MQKSAYLFFYTFFKNLIFFKSFFNNLSGKVSYIRGEKNGDSRLQSVCTQSDLYWNRWGKIMENILDGFGINIQMSRCPFKEPWRWYGR